VTDLPEPLTPADCNLRGLPFMPMMVAQVMQSETFALSSGDEFKAAFTLWCASWLEVPAASLPNDDRMLEFLSRAKSWKKVKSMALRGWVLCADGRLYHAVLAEQAVDAWEKRTVYREKEDGKSDRQRRWREQCKQLAAQLRDVGVVPPKGASLEALRSLLEARCVDAKTSTDVDASVDGRDVGEMPKTGTVKGQGQLTTKTTPETPAPDDSPSPSAVGALCIAMRTSGVMAQPADPRMIALAAQGVQPETATAACEEAKRSKPGERIPPGLVIAILERWAREAAALKVAGAGQPRASPPTKHASTQRLLDRINRKATHEPDDRIIDLNDRPA
jgi:Protein of unknown function (DUF1376)